MSRISQPDRIVEDGALGDIGIRSPKRAASMPPIEWPTMETRVIPSAWSSFRVPCHVMKVVGNDRFRGAAETDRVGHDDAEAGVAEQLDRSVEINPPKFMPWNRTTVRPFGVPAGGTSI